MDYKDLTLRLPTQPITIPATQAMAAPTPTEPTSTKKRAVDVETEQTRPAKRIRLFPKKVKTSPAPARTITVKKSRTPEMQPWIRNPGYDNSALLRRRIAPERSNNVTTPEIAHEREMRHLSITTTLHHDVVAPTEAGMPDLRRREMGLALLAKTTAEECFPGREERFQRGALRVLIGWFGRLAEGDGEHE